jgi:hypothetical protein
MRDSSKLGAREPMMAVPGGQWLGTLDQLVVQQAFSDYCRAFRPSAQRISGYRRQISDPTATLQRLCSDRLAVGRFVRQTAWPRMSPQARVLIASFAAQRAISSLFFTKLS